MTYEHAPTYENDRDLRFRIIEAFTQGKLLERNEDAIASGSDRIVLSDGATDKTGFRYDGKTGGQLASEAVVASAMRSGAIGSLLITMATRTIQRQYEAINPTALYDSAHRYGATLVDVRLVWNEQTKVMEVVATQVGDSGFRITRRDGRQELFYSTKLIDRENGALRAAYIRVHPDDIEGGRAAIMDRLTTQHKYQNVPSQQSPYGYGVIDGSQVPEEFIHVRRWPAVDVAMVELFSDGYASIPATSTLDAFETELARQNRVDPHRLGLGGFEPQTKTNDDRTYVRAMITGAA